MEESYPLATGTTDKGLVREKNEDHYFVDPLPGGWLLVVCDGMGGHVGGQMASEIAVNVLREAIEGCLSGGGELDILGVLEEALLDANASIFDMAQGNPEYQNMGTTAVVVLVLEGQAYIAHVGDSRVYVHRGGELKQITRDHSKVQQMMDNEILDEEQAKKHPDAHVLLRALGIKPEVEPEVMPDPIEVKKGDSFLLCSDGLTDVVEDEEIEELLFLPVDEAMENMVLLAKERGAPDNITIAVYRQGPPKKRRRRRKAGARPPRTLLRRVLLGLTGLVVLAAVAGVAFFLGQGDEEEPKPVAVSSGDVQIDDRDAGPEEADTPAKSLTEHEEKVKKWQEDFVKEGAGKPDKPEEVENPPVVDEKADVPTVAKEPEIEAKEVKPVEKEKVLTTVIECDPTTIEDQKLSYQVADFLQHLADARGALTAKNWDGSMALAALKKAAELDPPISNCRDKWNELAGKAKVKQKGLVFKWVKQGDCGNARGRLKETKAHLKIKSMPEAERWVNLCDDIQSASRDVASLKGRVAKLKNQVSQHANVVKAEEGKISGFNEVIQTETNKLPDAEAKKKEKDAAALKMDQDMWKPIKEAEKGVTEANQERDTLTKELEAAKSEKDKTKIQGKLDKALEAHKKAEESVKNLQALVEATGDDAKRADSELRKINNTIFQQEEKLSKAEEARKKAESAHSEAQAKLGVAQASRKKVKKRLALLLEQRKNLKYDPPD